MKYLVNIRVQVKVEANSFVEAERKVFENAEKIIKEQNIVILEAVAIRKDV